MITSRLLLLPLAVFGLMAKASVKQKMPVADKNTVQLTVTVRVPLAMVSITHSVGTRLDTINNDMIFPKGTPSVIKKQLPGVPQIIYVINTPVFTCAGQNVEMFMNKGKVVNVPSHYNQVISFKGPFALKQSLPYVMDSLYVISEDKLSAMDLTQLKEHFNSIDKKVNTLMAKAKVLKPVERMLLQRYSGMLRMNVKAAFLSAHLAKKDLPANFTEWYLKGENLEAATLNRVCNLNKINAYLANIEKAKRMDDPQWSGLKEMTDLLKYGNPLLNKVVVYSWFKQELRFKELSPELQKFYPIMKATFTDPNDIKLWDDLYPIHENMMEGKPAYNFAFADAKGKIVKLSDLRGKMVVIDCWGTWCSGCRAEMPYFEKVAETYKDKTGIIFMTMALEGKGDPAWENYLIEHHMENGLNLKFYDDWKDKNYVDFRRSYNLNSYPRYIAIDSKGNILTTHLELPSNPIFKERVDKWYNEKR